MSEEPHGDEQIDLIAAASARADQEFPTRPEPLPYDANYEQLMIPINTEEMSAMSHEDALPDQFSDMHSDTFEDFPVEDIPFARAEISVESTSVTIEEILVEDTSFAVDEIPGEEFSVEEMSITVEEMPAIGDELDDRAPELDDTEIPAADQELQPTGEGIPASGENESPSDDESADDDKSPSADVSEETPAHSVDESAAPTTPEVEPFPEALADKYERLGTIASGGMATVYKASLRETRQVVAIKLFDTSRDRDGRFVRRFREEAAGISKLSSANLVTIHEFGVAEDKPYLVMEFVEGRTLADIFQEKGVLSEDQFVEVFEQVCDGLREAHNAGIVHQDLKPSNLLIIEQTDGSWLVKVADFGIAKSAETTPGIGIDVSQTSEAYGTPAYMSPEQCMGRPADKRSDIFGLGCIMYEAVTGIRPNCGDTDVDTVRKRLTESPKTFAELDIKVSKKLDRLISKCLQRNLDTRYQTIDELRRDLLVGRKRKPKPRKPISPATIRKIIVGAATVCAVAAAGTFLAIKFAPFDTEAHWQLFGKAVAQRNDKAASIEMLQIIEKAPADPKWHAAAFQFAQELAQQGKHARAEDIFKALVNRFAFIKPPPAERAKILKAYGESLTKQGNDVTAKQVYEQLVALQGTYRSDRVTTGLAEQFLGDIARRRQQPGEAADHYLKAIRLFRNTPAYIGSVADNYGALLQEQGNYSEAGRYFRLAKESWLKAFGPKNTSSVYGTTLLADFYLKTNQHALAEASLRESLGMLQKIPHDNLWAIERTRLLEVYRRLLAELHRRKDLPRIESQLH